MNKFNYTFEQCSEFFDTLDTSKLYCFLLLSTTDNRIVSKGQDFVMKHICTISNLSDMIDIDLDDDIGISKPQEIKLSNLDELFNHISNINTDDHQGVIAFGKNNKQIKILNDLYKELYNVRGNEPSIKFRYLQVRHDKDMVQKLYDLYPTYSAWFELYEKTIYETAVDILNAYITRFVIRDYISIPPQEYYILNECNALMERNRTQHINALPNANNNINTSNNTSITNTDVNGNRILNLTLNDVQFCINQKSASELNKIVKHRCFAPLNSNYYSTPGRNFYYNMRNNQVNNQVNNQ